ncbi:hypothetical protein D030_1801A, partial [Vibrio parahaemolyticus AQ3810]
MQLVGKLANRVVTHMPYHLNENLGIGVIWR